MRRKKVKRIRSRSLSPRDRELLDAIKNREELFLGLSVQDKMALASSIRGVGARSNVFKGMFKKPTKEDYASMTLAATKAILNRNGNGIRPEKAKVAVRLPYNYRDLSPDFPYALAIDADVLSTTVRVNACAFIDWLHKHGHSAYNSKQLRETMRGINGKLRDLSEEVAFIRDYCADSAYLELLEVIYETSKN